MEHIGKIIKDELAKEVSQEDHRLLPEPTREQEIAMIRENKRLSCGIPAKFQSVRFDTFDTKRPGNVNVAYRACVKYADNYNLRAPAGHKSLILTSARIWGNGKSHLACSILHRILDRWNGERGFCSMLFITEPDMFSRIQKTYNRDRAQGAETEDAVFNLLSKVGLLVVDDVGKVTRSDPRFVQSTWFKVIDKRYSSELPIVLTCNLNATEFYNHFGGKSNEASYSRLKDMSKGNRIEINSPSYRDEVKK